MENPIVEMLRGQIGGDAKMNPSPAGKWLNGTIRKVEEGMTEVEFVVREEMTNLVGGLHGGMLSLIMDEVIGMTLFTMNNEYLYTSINLNVDFLRPAFKGNKLTAKTKVVRLGRNVSYVACEVVNEENKIVGVGHSNMAVTKNKIR